MIYECHITCLIKDAEKAQQIADLIKWKTSQIARDVTLGDDTYFYLTCHERDLFEMMSKLNHTANELEMANVFVVRKKIELIIYDTKMEKSTSKLVPKDV